MTSAANTQRTITFCNSTGDITIAWEDDKEAEMLALVQEKMNQSYSFFILKPRVGGLLGTKKVEVTNIEQVREAGHVVVSDALAKAVVMRLGDDAVSAAVQSGVARVTSVEKQRSVDTIGRADTAQEVLQNSTVAFRPLVGG